MPGSNSNTLLSSLYRIVSTCADTSEPALGTITITYNLSTAHGRAILDTEPVQVIVSNIDINAGAIITFGVGASGAIISTITTTGTDAATGSYTLECTATSGVLILTLSCAAAAPAVSVKARIGNATATDTLEWT